jgi:response regulator RpfG family c-di-GMP phosphodiesterase
VFDVMTTKRANQRTASLQQVLEYQQQQAGAQFDPEMVQCWISVMNKT